MFMLKLRHPTKTKAGKVAQSSHYEVVDTNGGNYESMTIRAFCEKNDLSMPAMIRQVKLWVEGDYTDEFAKVVNSMKKRVRGAYAKQGKGLVCPHCGKNFHKMDATFARRRQLRDASPPNHILRAMDPSYFGERPALDEPATSEAPRSLEPAGTGSATIS